MKKQFKFPYRLPPNVKITHVLPDGTEVDSIEGMSIPYLPETHAIYELFAKYESIAERKKGSEKVAIKN
jgi:hypothetical protein